MRHFLFAHIHWLWFLLHWLHHDLYARWTFGIFVFIGLAQTIIAWESGELAVKALPQELLTSEKVSPPSEDISLPAVPGDDIRSSCQ
jgi:hypothetical protein